MSPNQVLLGYLPTLNPEAPTNTINKHVEERMAQAKEFWMQAQAALNTAANKTPEDQFDTSNLVWLEAKNLNLPYQACKLAPKCHGPFTITKQVSPVAYQLQLPPAWTIHNVFHTSLLTRYHETQKHGPNYTQPPPQIIDGDQEFEVERVMGHRYFGKGHKLQYLIKWQGYPTADNTWEPKELVFAPKLIAAYHQEHLLTQPFLHKKGT